MLFKFINVQVRNQLIRTYHHSKKLEDYQAIALKKKLVDIETILSNISRELKSINNLVESSSLETITQHDKYICKMCLVDQLISRRFFENNKIINDSQKHICTICGNNRK